MEEIQLRQSDLALSAEQFYARYGRRKTVGAFTLGCKTNQYETDAVLDMFYKAGYAIVDFDDPADVYVINTCTVTQMGDKKSRQMIRRAHAARAEGMIVVMGCYAQISSERVSEIEGVDIVIGTHARHDILKYIDAVASGAVPRPHCVVEDIMAVTQFEEMPLERVDAHTRAFIKIQEGCNQYCTYCIIPYARGRVRSRHLEDVVSEVTTLAQKGYLEFVITGIHIGSYGIDLEDVRLIDLLERLDAIPGVARIRLGSIEPTLITDAFISRIRVLKRLCPHFHLSLQSGANSTLKRMNRRYTAEAYADAVERLRAWNPDVSLTTDVIVGFPGETDAAFLESYTFVERMRFSEIHVFPYSNRSGTPAARMPDQVEAAVKKRRSAMLIELGRAQIYAYRKAFDGMRVQVLLEACDGVTCTGYTDTYIRVEVEAHQTIQIDTRGMRSGALCTVRLSVGEDGRVYGEQL